MGIPSYFKHILDRYPRLLGAASGNADVLLMDFNCLIYGVIRGPTMPTYSHATRDAWESAALTAINKYVVDVWTTAGRPAQVYLAVDGVVPMAKMRQQRLRRFKSVWMTAQERALGVRAPGQEVWDTNAITPGTEFMERLGTSLRSLCAARGPGWCVSGADEEGEGEQKLMAWARSHDDLEGKRIYVYGLDADLIVLCLLHAGVLVPGASWSILRERQEFGGKGESREGPTFLTLDVGGLVDVLWPRKETRTQDIYDYVCGMSLLGNDFVPHSMTINIRLGGHDMLIADLASMAAGGLRLTRMDAERGLVVNTAGLRHMMKTWAATEDDDMLRGIQRKYKMRQPPARSEAERAMMGVQNLPLEWAAENCLWSPERGILHEDWRDRYYAESAPAALEDIRARCEAWCAGLQWILDYYTGQRPVSRTWFYPWSHPPLWADLEVFLEKGSCVDVSSGTERPVQPQEQLAIVLPMESWGLIRDARLRAVAAHMPAFWPKKFEFESLGKRWMWECEPRIPILTPARLRAVLVAASN